MFLMPEKSLVPAHAPQIQTHFPLVLGHQTGDTELTADPPAWACSSPLTNYGVLQGPL